MIKAYIPTFQKEEISSPAYIKTNEKLRWGEVCVWEFRAQQSQNTEGTVRQVGVPGE